MQEAEQTLEKFISYFAIKIDAAYNNSCADAEDYIQAGHLKLAEIKAGGHNKNNFTAYAIVSIARAMRDTALGAMCVVSAPCRVKRQIHQVEMLSGLGKNDHEICEQLQITGLKLEVLRSMLHPQSWQTLFVEPVDTIDPFSVLSDILSSINLTKEDKDMIVSQMDGQINKLGLSRKQRWLRTRNLRPKLMRSGYGI
jgi:DNA-directed RNA polymerase specialized sigma subunit